MGEEELGLARDHVVRLAKQLPPLAVSHDRVGTAEIGQHSRRYLAR